MSDELFNDLYYLDKCVVKNKKRKRKKKNIYDICNKNRIRINQLNVTNENKNGLLRNVSRNFCVMCICCGVSII